MARVLIVDDTAFMRMVLKGIFQRNGHEVVGECGNGLEAVEKYKELSPDLVTMDITMPEMDGITAVKQIKGFHPEAKVIMCSALGEETKMLEAINAGALDFIVKPFSEEKIVQALARFIKE